MRACSRFGCTCVGLGHWDELHAFVTETADRSLERSAPGRHGVRIARARRAACGDLRAANAGRPCRPPAAPATGSRCRAPARWLERRRGCPGAAGGGVRSRSRPAAGARRPQHGSGRYGASDRWWKRRALIRKGEKGTIHQQFDNLKLPVRQLAKLSTEYTVLITHGNGPQVGNLMLQQEYCELVPNLPLEILVAQIGTRCQIVLSRSPRLGFRLAVL